MKKKAVFKILTLVLTLAMLASVLVACADNSSKSTTIKIGSQGYAEVEILAEIFKAVIEAKTDHKVEHVRSLGSAMAGFEATKSNDLQAFTGFTGTFFLGLLEQEMTDENRDPQTVYEITRDMMDEQYDMYCAEPWGYNNTYGIAVARTWAEENNVKTQSDMAKFAPDMKLAVDQTWLNYPGQGYNEYTKIYGLSTKKPSRWILA
jgi:osmoprotectant transport system substrate-binding protein